MVKVHHVNHVDYMMQNKTYRDIIYRNVLERSPFALHVQRSIVIQHCIFSCDRKAASNDPVSGHQIKELQKTKSQPQSDYSSDNPKATTQIPLGTTIQPLPLFHWALLISSKIPTHAHRRCCHSCRTTCSLLQP